MYKSRGADQGEHTHRDVVEHLVEVSLARLEARKAGGGQAVAASGQAPMPGDALEDLLGALAGVYNVHPDLWLDEDQR